MQLGANLAVWALWMVITASPSSAENAGTRKVDGMPFSKKVAVGTTLVLEKDRRPVEWQRGRAPGMGASPAIPGRFPSAAKTTA